MSEVDILSDPRVQQMGSLLQRMTGAQDEGPKFTRAMVTSWIEVALPRVASQMPGLPAGMTATIEKHDEDSWTLHITRPKSDAAE